MRSAFVRSSSRFSVFFGTVPRAIGPLFRHVLDALCGFSSILRRFFRTPSADLIGLGPGLPADLCVFPRRPSLWLL